MIREYYSLIDSGILVSVPKRTKTEPKDRGRARRTRPRLIHALLVIAPIAVWDSPHVAPWHGAFGAIARAGGGGGSSRNRLDLFFSQFTRIRFTLIVHTKVLPNRALLCDV